MSQLRTIIALLEPTAVDRPVGDACGPWARQAADILRAAGIEAQEAAVFGWGDAERRLLSFGHRVVLVAGQVVDGTARQFDPRFPALSMGELDTYLEILCKATGAVECELRPEPAA